MDLLIERNLLNVRELVAKTEARDGTKEKTKGEATSTSLESKKKEVVKLKNPHINNEDIEKILVQLVGAVMKVEYLLKCLIVFFFGLALVAKNWWMHVSKMCLMK